MKLIQTPYVRRILFVFCRLFHRRHHEQYWSGERGYTDFSVERKQKLAIAPAAVENPLTRCSATLALPI